MHRQARPHDRRPGRAAAQLSHPLTAESPRPGVLVVRAGQGSVVEGASLFPRHVPGMFTSCSPPKISRLLPLAALTILWGGVTRSVVAQEEFPSYLVWQPNLRHESLPAPEIFRDVTGPSRFETDGLGIRGPDFGPSREAEYRILFLGGSAVESFYLDQPKAWPALVAARLGSTADGRAVWVGNLGKSGHSSRDHVMELRLLIPKLPVDVIAVMMGVNDLGLRLAQDRSYNPDFLATNANLAYQIRHTFAVQPSDPNLPFYRQGWLGRLLGLQPESLRVKPYQVVDNAGWAFEHWRQLRRKAPKIDTLPPLRAALEEYARNIREIARRGHAMGARVVFLTQPALWRSGLDSAETATLWMGGVGDFQRSRSRYYTPRALGAGLAAYNRVLMQTCRESGAECFDLAAQIPQDLTMFYDDCHFNEGGSRLVAALVADYFAERRPFGR